MALTAVATTWTAPAAGAEAGVAAAGVTPRLKPPAPEPAYISRDDLARIASVRTALEAKRFSDARRAAEFIEQPIARSLGLWYYFDAEDPLVSFPDAKAFLDAHPDWPSLSRLQAHAEKSLPAALPAAEIIDFFEQRDPVTMKGKMSLVRALVATGASDAAAERARAAWRTDTFTLEEERAFLGAFGRFLTAEDHVARVDDLLSRLQVTNARRVFRFLPGAERRRAEVRAELLLQSAGADRAYERLADADRLDRGVFHGALRRYRRTGEETRAIQIARAYDAATAGASGAAAPGRDDAGANAVWTERQLLMRYALKERLYADAYAMAAGHGLPAGSTAFSEAEFNAGWIALRFLDDAARAKLHFAALTASVGSPISLGRGYYWLGRADDAAGDATAAEAWYAAAAEYPYTFYGQLAAERIGGAALEAIFEAAPEPGPEDRARFAARPAAQALRMLSEIGDARAFLIFGYHLDDILESPGEFVELAEAAARLPAPHVTVRAGKAGTLRGVFAPQVSYPTIFVPEEATRYAPPEVILGLSRQESEFNARAYSRAGARGLMQLMPATAKITAVKERIAYAQSYLLDDPNYNMLIGSAHLSHLVSDLDGSWPMVFGAYNAGKGRVDRWIEEYGDPRTDAIDPIDWIELIPFAETRNYVQRVLENMQVYRSALSGAPLAGRLAADVESGGATGRAGQGPAIAAGGLTPEPRPEVVAIAEAFLAVPRPQAGADATEASLAPLELPATAPSRDPTTAGAGIVRAPTQPSSKLQTGAAPGAGPAAPLASPPAAIAAAPSADDEACAGYVAYLASQDPQAAARDLNAGVLAELNNRGGACAPTGPAAPAAPAGAPGDED